MRIITILILVLFMFSEGFSQSIENGKGIFNTNCKVCHTIGEGRRVGPDLAGITERREKEWIFKFITNSAGLIESGDEQAMAIFAEFNKIPMPPHPLSDIELEDVVSYIGSYEIPTIEEEKPAEETEATVQVEKVEAMVVPTWIKVIFGSLAFAVTGLLVLIVFLFKMVRSY
jgi:mono/diheme cytochrome c family protein